MGDRGGLAEVPADRWIKVWRRGSSSEVEGPPWNGLRALDPPDRAGRAACGGTPEM
jgi:hypothetical protein